MLSDSHVQSPSSLPLLPIARFYLQLIRAFDFKCTMVDKEQCCKKLCAETSIIVTTDELCEDASTVGARVQQTWPPTHGGSGFSAFSAKVEVESGGGREILVVVFRGTRGTMEWLQYPLSAVSGDPIATIEGLRVFSVWADILEKVTELYCRELSIPALKCFLCWYGVRCTACRWLLI